MGTKDGLRCKYCGGEVTEIGNVYNFGLGEYECNSMCEGYFNADFFMSTQDVLLETTLETTSS